MLTLLANCLYCLQNYVETKTEVSQVFSLVLNPHAFKHLHLLEINHDEKKSLRGLNPNITCLESIPHLSLSQRFYKIHFWGQMSLFKSSSVIFKVSVIASPHKRSNLF